MSKLKSNYSTLFVDMNLFYRFLFFSFLCYLLAHFTALNALASAPVFPNNSFVGILFSAGAKDPMGIYDAANASGAIKTKTPQDKEKAFSAIQKAYDDYMKANPTASPGQDMYRAIEISLGRQKLLTYNAVLPKEAPVVVEMKKPKVPVVPQAPIVQQQATFSDKFFTALNNAPLDAYGIFGLLNKKGMLTEKALKDQKGVAKLISGVIKPEQAKLQERVSGTTIKEIMTKLDSQGYLKKF